MWNNLPTIKWPFPENYNSYFFRFCKSVRHCTIQINHQPDATVFQFIILTFIYSSTCFGRFPVHHQGLNDCSGTLWFYPRIVVTVVLCLWSGRSIGKTPETCWAVNKRQDNKLKNCCIRLVIYLNCNCCCPYKQSVPHYTRCSATPLYNHKQSVPHYTRCSATPLYNHKQSVPHYTRCSATPLYNHKQSVPHYTRCSATPLYNTAVQPQTVRAPLH